MNIPAPVLHHARMPSRPLSLSQRVREFFPDANRNASREDAARRRNDPAQAKAEAVRQSSRWKHLRLVVLRAEPCCRPCVARGTTTAATEVDHIIALVDGGAPFERANLQPVCSPCHHAKSAAERAARWVTS